MLKHLYCNGYGGSVRTTNEILLENDTFILYDFPYYPQTIVLDVNVLKFHFYSERASDNLTLNGKIDQVLDITFGGESSITKTGYLDLTNLIVVENVSLCFRSYIRGVITGKNVNLTRLYSFNPFEQTAYVKAVNYANIVAQSYLLTLGKIYVDAKYLIDITMGVFDDSVIYANNSLTNNCNILTDGSSTIYVTVRDMLNINSNGESIVNGTTSPCANIVNINSGENSAVYVCATSEINVNVTGAAKVFYSGLLNQTSQSEEGQIIPL
ncbi:unnamed protein product [Didymodactylos carnosus]|uniref:Uncharacterized protein n=1 Tax=Didymodactylos carnosus TaxID=1234261 RepID=A0A814XPD1_9BILA|nr:unnamed protein product [Didymodactylos carnosus]CAF3979309.1 unnamed protein product [Didymodactylos carnosus]